MNERLIRAAVSQVDDSILITDALLELPGPRILYTNAAFTQMTGYTQEEVLGKTPRMLQGPETDPAVVQRIRDALRTGTIFKGRAIQYRKDGSTYWQEWHISPLRDGEGRISHYIAIQRDVTADVEREQQLAEAEQRLRQSQKLEAIGALAAGVAHEISTPIQYIGDNLRFVERMSRRLVPGSEEEAIDADLMAYAREQLPRALEQCFEGIERVSTIVRAMKAFAHPPMRDKTPSDINRCIRDTVTVATAEWKHIADIKLELATDLPAVTCYPGDINQALLNLVVNAAHAIQAREGDVDPGRIEIRSSASEDHVKVRIEDNGVGISEQVKERIFDPFFTTKKAGKGTGQGLHIAYAAIHERHGGELLCHSTPGVGTVFEITLPLLADGKAA